MKENFQTDIADLLKKQESKASEEFVQKIAELKTSLERESKRADSLNDALLQSQKLEKKASEKK